MEPVGDFLSRMKAVYDAMDAAYSAVARNYGFDCAGCEDNCCTQRFYHHTLAEYYYLYEGLRTADPELARKILVKARVVVDSYRHELHAGSVLPLMCPVNFDGLCRLYEHRPMICRMHGLPHRFFKPDGTEERGGGCARFEAGFGKKSPAGGFVDRTILYTSLAAIERDIRERTLFRGRYRKTTAEMLLDMLAGDERLQRTIEEEYS